MARNDLQYPMNQRCNRIMVFRNAFVMSLRNVDKSEHFKGQSDCMKD